MELITDQLTELLILIVIGMIAYAVRQVTPLVESGVQYLRDADLIQKGDDLEAAIDNAVWFVETAGQRLGIAGKGEQKLRQVRDQARTHAQKLGLQITDREIDRMAHRALAELKAAGQEIKAAAVEAGK